MKTKTKSLKKNKSKKMIHNKVVPKNSHNNKLTNAEIRFRKEYEIDVYTTESL